MNNNLPSKSKIILQCISVTAAICSIFGIAFAIIYSGPIDTLKIILSTLWLVTTIFFIGVVLYRYFEKEVEDRNFKTLQQAKYKQCYSQTINKLISKLHHEEPAVENFFQSIKPNFSCILNGFANICSEYLPDDQKVKINAYVFKNDFDQEKNISCLSQQGICLSCNKDNYFLVSLFSANKQSRVKLKLAERDTCIQFRAIESSAMLSLIDGNDTFIENHSDRNETFRSPEELQETGNCAQRVDALYAHNRCTKENDEAKQCKRIWAAIEITLENPERLDIFSKEKDDELNLQIRDLVNQIANLQPNAPTQAELEVIWDSMASKNETDM